MDDMYVKPGKLWTQHYGDCGQITLCVRVCPSRPGSPQKRPFHDPNFTVDLDIKHVDTKKVDRIKCPVNLNTDFLETSD